MQREVQLECLWVETRGAVVFLQWGGMSRLRKGVVAVLLVVIVG